MKCKLLLAFVGVAAMLTGCNNEQESDFAPQAEPMTFTVGVDDQVNTRATPSEAPTRFVMEIYEGTSATGTAAKHVEQANGTFSDVILRANQDYTVLFWADYGTKDVNNADKGYNAADLKDISINGQAEKMAFAGSKKFNSTTDKANSYSVTLTHAVAKISYVQSEVFTGDNNTLSVILPKSYKLNVDGTTVTEVSGEVTHTFGNLAKGTVNTAFATSYIFASNDGGNKTLMDLKLTFNSESEKSVTNVPFQCNYSTNLKGAYSNLYTAGLTVSCEDTWGENVTDEFPKLALNIGYYYTDGSWGTYYRPETEEIYCIGITLTWNKGNGLMISLKEATMQWRTANTAGTGAYDKANGANNMAAIKNISNWGTGFPAFKWCADQTAGGQTWYLPSHEELLIIEKALKVSSGLTLATALSTAKAGAIEGKYWSSTENQANTGNSFWVDFSSFNANDAGQMTTQCKVRAMCLLTI